MKTLLSQFCDDFSAALAPILPRLKDFADRIGQERAAGSAAPRPALVPREQVADFREVSLRLRALADKVAEQQAYVLIFGPLKSGKSTLMNAISGSYVSEVTALPAYPCMVYVRHAPKLEFLVTRYSGDTQTFGSSASMRMQIGRDHGELAERIRAEERSGRDFDPALHFPAAIRRIDVKVSAPDLAESGAVLVDTPGLYSRMKFGYDRMTREFRDAAACAIFVVKTDNLFLEQVFDEFNDLLQLFSRIFLVVNLDGNKRDLKPDGTLAPSLEREDPVRVIEAFETLSMTSPLKSAIEAGRLRIYPVDLLQAASERLRSRQGSAEPSHNRGDFEAFIQDLSDYLSSTDYLVAFLGDSLRQADLLLEESQRLCRHHALRSLLVKADDLEREKRHQQQLLGAIDRLAGEDWTAAFGALGRRLVESGQSAQAPLEDQARRGIQNALRGWFQSDRSLAALIDGELAPLLTGFQSELAGELQLALRQAAGGAHAGAVLPNERLGDLERLRLSLADFAAEGLVAVSPRATVKAERPSLDVSELPVRRTLWDWLFFRSQAAVRRRLFGAAGAGQQPIPRHVKEQRLGEAGLRFLSDQLEDLLDGWFTAQTQRIGAQLAADYRRPVLAALLGRLEARRQEGLLELESIEQQLGELAQITRSLRELEQELAAGDERIALLSERYQATDPRELVRELQPVPRREPSEGAVGAPPELPAERELDPSEARARPAPGPDSDRAEI
jgi:GTPase SAR1 family protein